jgi:hypothetical protein
VAAALVLESLRGVAPESSSLANNKLMS